MTRSAVTGSIASPGNPAQQNASGLNLRAVTYAERTQVLATVNGVVSSGGCFLREWRMLSIAQIEFHFQMYLRSAVEVYSALIGSGLELTQAGHAELTSLCTLRRHNERTHNTLGRVVSVRLEVSFLSEMEEQFSGAAGLA